MPSLERTGRIAHQDLSQSVFRAYGETTRRGLLATAERSKSQDRVCEIPALVKESAQHVSSLVGPLTPIL